MTDEGIVGTVVAMICLALIITIGIGVTKSNVLDKQIEWERQQTLKHCVSAGRAPADCKAMVAK
jgi:hypothetical protein